MSNVTLTIGGRSFTVAAANGEESHVGELGRMIDAMVSSGGLRSLSEPRMLLFAALMMADELHEARVALAATLQESPEPEPEPALILEAHVEERVGDIARRLEAIAQHLEDIS